MATEQFPVIYEGSHPVVPLPQAMSWQEWYLWVFKNEPWRITGGSRGR